VSLIVPLLFAMLFGLVATGLSSAARAQDEATPTAEEDFDLPEGVSFEALAYGTAENLPATGDIVLFRIRLEPGAVFPVEPDPAPGLVVVEEGAVTIAVDSPLTVLRAAKEGTPFPIETEQAEADTDVDLETGDSTVVQGGASGELRNEGDEEAVLLVAIVTQPDNVDDTATDGPAGGATPAADDAADDGSTDAAGESVDIQDFAFSPDTLEISVGTTVTWTNGDAAPHTATAEDGAFDSGSLATGDSYSFTFEEPGTYSYFCEFHPNMQGTIVVS
jgi:plastocyanin